MFEKQRNTKSSDSKSSDSSPRETASSAAVAEAPHSARGNALIGASIRINGDVSGDENLTIEGLVEGSIDLASNEVTIGKSGRVNADVTAKMIRIDGEVKGNISGHEKVVISKTGKVQGNIIAPRVTLEDGAKFRGSIDMDPSERGLSGTTSANIGSANTALHSEVSQVASTSASTSASVGNQ